MINVYLDDLRPCPKGFILARNIRECITLLEEYEIGILSLDHDLGWNEPTGYEVAKYMTDHGKYAREIYLHTSSSIGCTNMFQLLQKHKPEFVKVHPFAMPDEVLEQIRKLDMNSIE